MGNLHLLLPVAAMILVISGQQYKLVCVFTNWSQYRQRPSKFFPDYVDGCLCTHINFAFATISSSFEVMPLEFNDRGRGNIKGSYQSITELKAIGNAPNLKVLLSIGGWNQGSAPFTVMLQNSTTFNIFVNSAIQFARAENFDGIDIAWEFHFPEEQPTANHKGRYTDMLRELRNAIEQEATDTRRPPLLLSVTLAAVKEYIDLAYNISAIVDSIDYANIMAYDYHDQCETKTGLNAPLYSGDEEHEITLNQNWTINYYIGLGLPKNKIVMGLPTYGRQFTLKNTTDNGVGSPAIVGRDAGDCSKDTGQLTYFRICEGLTETRPGYRWTEDRNPMQVSPFAYWGSMWVAYDDVRSLTNKSRYIIDNELGGAMIWSFDFDDFNNECMTGRYPLINAVRNTLGVDACAGPSSSTMPTGTVTTRSSTATPPRTQSTRSVGTTTARSVGTTTIPSRNTTDNQTCPNTDYNLVCYFHSASVDVYLYPEAIHSTMCTHIIFAFGILENNTVKESSQNDIDPNEGLYQGIMQLRTENPSLKILLSLGGWGHPTQPFINMLSSVNNIGDFVVSALAFLRHWEFDGIDIAWLFPVDSGDPAILDQYNNMITALRVGIDAEIRQPGRERLLLTAAMGALKNTIDNSYRLSSLASSLDFINVFSFDYHTQCDPRTGLNAPLFGRSDQQGEETYLNQNWTINYFISNGVPREKLNLGIPTYGRQFTLNNEQSYGNGALTRRSVCARESGIKPYPEICSFLANRGLRKWDTEQLAPYAVYRRNWIGYDDQESVTIKANYIKEQGLGGAMIWSLGADDFNGECGQGLFPLTNTIKCTLSEPLLTTTVTSITTDLTEPTGITTKSTASTATGPTGPTATVPTGITTQSTFSTPTRPTGPTPTVPTGITTKSTFSTATRPTDLTGITTTPTPCYAPKVPRLSTEEQDFATLCSFDQLIPYNKDCTRYIHCTTGSGSAEFMTCPACLYFNKEAMACDYPINVSDCPPFPITSPTVSPSATRATTPTTTQCNAPPRARNTTERPDYFTLCFEDSIPGIRDHYTYVNDCTKYVHCLFKRPIIRSCPPCLYYDDYSMVCEHPGKVLECQGPVGRKRRSSSGRFRTKRRDISSTVNGSCDLDGTLGHRRRTTANIGKQNFNQLCTRSRLLLPVNQDCGCYVRCRGRRSWSMKSCPHGLYFNSRTKRCDIPGNVLQCQ